MKKPKRAVKALNRGRFLSKKVGFITYLKALVYNDHDG